MARINYAELRKQSKQLGPDRAGKLLREAIRDRYITANDFSIREAAEACLGRDFVRSMDPRANSGFVSLTEGGFDGVDVTAFSNITGQIVYSKLLEAYQAEDFVASRIIPVVPTRLDGEKIPGVNEIGDQAAVVQPGMPYPNIGFGENYIETPSTTKRGLIVPVTKEAIFFDRTNLIVQRAAAVGEALGISKEKRLCDVAWGIGSGNTWKWKGTTYDSYSIDASTAGYGGTSIDFINQITDELVDWTDIDAAEIAFAALTDPATSEPIMLNANTLWVQRAYLNAARRIMGAESLRYGANSDTVQTFYGNNVYASKYNIVCSNIAYKRIVAVGNAGGAESAATAKKWWLLFDPAKAFAYMENWPITVVQAPANNEAEFTQDVVLRYKASERGTAAVLDPHYAMRSNPTHA